MRISLLLQREPFGQLLERTMCDYWQAALGRPVEVRWQTPAAGDQIWRGNIYLNFFCVAGVSPGCFEVIRREFGFARAAWRRALQSMYVRAAVTAPARSWLSQVCFGVSVEVPDAHEQLLIGGNRRMRIIQPQRGRSIVIHKHGFSRLAFDREVRARTGAAAALAPRFDGVDASGRAFHEEYFAGTPANRMRAAAETRARQAAIARLIAEVHRPTLRVRRLADHVARLCATGAALCPAAGESLLAWEDWLRGLAPSVAVGICLTHGDFQDANILVAGERLHVIDWEAAAERSQLYDLATLASGVRLAPEALGAWRQTVCRWRTHPESAPSLEIRPDGWTGWLAHAGVWWLEETILRLEESRMAEHVANQSAGDTALIEDLESARAFLHDLQ